MDFADTIAWYDIFYNTILLYMLSEIPLQSIFPIKQKAAFQICSA
jgi:hypothetical protein